MARKYFNWKLLVVIILAFLVFGVTAYGLRKWQKGQTAEAALSKGLEAYQQKDWENAAMNLGAYILTSPDDVEVLHKYAESQLNIRPVNRNHIQQAIAAYRNILRAKKADLKAVKKLALIYIQMNMAGEAELILSRFPGIDNNPYLF